MKALISPEESCESGFRVAQVEQEAFDVGLPLFWVDCGDEIVADQFWYDPNSNAFFAKPEPEPQLNNGPIQGQQQVTVKGAQTL